MHPYINLNHPAYWKHALNKNCIRPINLNHCIRPIYLNHTRRGPLTCPSLATREQKSTKSGSEWKRKKAFFWKAWKTIKKTIAGWGIRPIDLTHFEYRQNAVSLHLWIKNCIRLIDLTLYKMHFRCIFKNKNCIRPIDLNHTGRGAREQKSTKSWTERERTKPFFGRPENLQKNDGRTGGRWKEKLHQTHTTATLQN